MFIKYEEWAAAEKDHLILWLPLFLGSGSAVYFALKSEPAVFIIAVLWLLTAVLLGLSYWHRNRSGFLPFFLALAIFTSMSGFGLAKIKTDLFKTPMLTRDSRPVLVQGTVIHTETLEARKGTVVILTDLKVENFTPAQTPKKIRLTSKLNIKFRLGDKVEVLAKLKPPSMPVMPDAYDFRRHYYFDGIGGMGFILKPPVVITSSSDKSLILENIRLSMGSHIKMLLPERLSGIVTAILTGERAAITKEDWDALRISGLAHIISISGLHVVLFAAPIFFFIRLGMSAVQSFALRYPIKKIAAFVALIGCSLYVLLVVPTVPTYRALLMTGIGLIAIIMDRSPFSLRLLAFAAITLLLLAPESVWSASFQLSFSAVLCLIMSAEWTRKYWSEWRNNASLLRKIILYVGGSIFTTLVVSVVTAPLAAYHFQQIPVYSVIANALVMPLTGLMIMPSVIASFLLWPFGLQDIALKVMGYGVEWMLAIAHGVAEMPGAALSIRVIPVLSVLLLAAAFLALILTVGKLRVAICAGCVLLSSLSVLLYKPPSILASSSGSLMMIRDGEKIYLSSSRSDKFVAENWIKRTGVDKENVIYFPGEGRIDLRDGFIACGAGACRIENNGQKITFGRDEYLLKRDCEWADYIITPTAFRKKSCHAHVFNKFEFADHGAIEIIKGDKVRTVAQSTGIRPWSPANDRYGSGSKARLEFGHDPASAREVYKRHSPALE